MSFTNIIDIEKEHLDRYSAALGGDKAREKIKNELLPLKSWFEEHGFIDDVELFARSHSYVFKIKGEDGYLIRTCPKNYEPRAVIPQLVQPLYTEIYKGLKIEILPQLKAIPSKIITEKRGDFGQEIKHSRYKIPGEVAGVDIGEFTYLDPKTGVEKSVPMAIDPGHLVKFIFDIGKPRCSDNYPTLQRQWEVHKELVNKYPRLQALLKGKPPASLPDTDVRVMSRSR